MYKEYVENEEKCGDSLKDVKRSKLYTTTDIFYFVALKCKVK